jgi:hypothetical protein|tara:strand:+ start:1113 stop:1346 length:234 start_codon:yes stop_codon:yes gene_type:complete
MNEFQEDQYQLEHLLFNERRCRTCNITKDLLVDFYLIRKNKKGFPSSYSYECKDCTKKRVLERKRNKGTNRWEYPDW